LLYWNKSTNSDAADAADGGLRSYNRQYWADIIALLNGSILMHDAEVFLYQNRKKNRKEKINEKQA
jgi:hypothetical protein